MAIATCRPLAGFVTWPKLRNVQRPSISENSDAHAPFLSFPWSNGDMFFAFPFPLICTALRAALVGDVMQLVHYADVGFGQLWSLGSVVGVAYGSGKQR